jgi:gelsolin
MLAYCLQPDLLCRPQKEGAESEQFWELLGGKTEYPSQKIVREAENDPHLFSCKYSEGKDQFLVSRVVLYDIYPPAPVSS